MDEFQRDNPRPDPPVYDPTKPRRWEETTVLHDDFDRALADWRRRYLEWQRRDLEWQRRYYGQQFTGADQVREAAGHADELAKVVEKHADDLMVLSATTACKTKHLAILAQQREGISLLRSGGVPPPYPAPNRIAPKPVSPDRASWSLKRNRLGVD